jgi:hypothetical protein
LQSHKDNKENVFKNYTSLVNKTGTKHRKNNQSMPNTNMIVSDEARSLSS